MIERVVAYVDCALIMVFMKLSHWVDYRWHINQYRLAAGVMHFAMALLVAGRTQRVIDNWRFAFLWVPAGGALIWMYGHYSDAMYRASAAWERNPSGIPRAAYMFVLMPHWFRLMALLFAAAITLMAAMVAHPKLDGPWYVVAIVSWYIASGVPPTRARKKKKQRTPWAALLLSPSRS